MERCSLSLVHSTTDTQQNGCGLKQEVFVSFHRFSFLRHSTIHKGILVFVITLSHNKISVSLLFLLIFYILPDDYLWCASTHDQSKDSTFYLKGDPP